MLASRHGIGLEQCGAMGDDLPDLPVLRQVAFAATVPSAPPLVRASAHYVTGHEGGRGAVRELCEFILNAQGTLDRALARYLR
jgi:3-deoxy-D-manno-octulosonate 8-phosphate phosphatase (KDO 8-P phosphatase)